MNSRNTSSYILLICIQAIILLLTTIGLIWGGISAELFFDKIDSLVIASAAVFVVMCIASLLSTRLYFIVLIFQLIAFPSLVDNLIPGVYLGSKEEIDAAIAPLFTHIDLFIILGVVKGFLLKQKLILIKSSLLLWTSLILLLSSVVNLFYSENTQEFLLMISGFMHLRYLIGFFVLLSLFDPDQYSKQILLGLILSVIFLLVEAFSFTMLSGADRLTSGTLGNNSFGNIIACIVVYLLFIRKVNTSLAYWLLTWIGIIVGIVIVVLTETRMAILAGLVLYVIGTYFHNRKSIKSLLYIVAFFFILGLSLELSGMYEKYFEGRFDVVQLISKIHVNPLSGDNSIEIEPSVETLSLITRLKLYNTSINMIVAHPFLGIGSVRWNYHKADYGFTERILLDAHNGYLAIVSQFGLLSLTFIYLIYFFPFRFLSKLTLSSNPNLFLALIPVGMAICDVSNSGIYKTQIYSLLAFIVVVLLYSLNKQFDPKI